MSGSMVRRRLLLHGLMAFVLAAPLRSRAQSKARRVTLVNRVAPLTEAFRAGLRDHGWLDGPRFVFEPVSEYTDTTAANAVQRAVESNPDVLVIPGGPNLAIASRLTQRVPIVGIDLESDPVAAGFIKTLARPGGNMTGVWLDLPELAGKQAQFVREIVPGAATIGALWDERVGLPQLNALQSAARANKFIVHAAVIRPESDVEAAVARLGKERVKALVALTAPIIFMNRARICDAALKHQLPLFSIFPNFPDAGALLGYGPNLAGMFRQAAGHVSRILNGAKPAEIPIERPAKFELVLNVKTGKTLGISLAPALLARADRVVE